MGVVVSSFLLTLVLSGAAFAHVTVSPGQVQPGATQQFTAVVPTEKDIPTTEVRLEIPDGFEVVEVRSPGGGWRGAVQGGAVTWSGGEIGAGNLEITSPEGEVIPMGESEEFTFEARAPESPGSYAWPATQTYEDGSAVEWAGPSDSAAPAPIIEVVATGQESTSGDAGHHDHGSGVAHEHGPGDHEHTTGGQEAAASGSGPSSPFLLAGVGALVASTATVVGMAFLRNRDRAPATTGRAGRRPRR